MAISINGPIVKTLATVAVTTTTATSTATFTIPIADSYTFFMDVSVAQTTNATVFLTSVDKGTTWEPVPWKFAGVTTTTGTFVLNVRSGLGPANDVSLVTGNGGLVAKDGTGTTALALQAVVDPNFMRFAYTSSGSASFVLYVAAWPRGATSGVD